MRRGPSDIGREEAAIHIRVANRQISTIKPVTVRVAG
jgi:hypothetical protein